MPTATSSGAPAASSARRPRARRSRRMADSRHERFADVIVGYSAGVEPGDLVTLETSTLATPLALELYRAVLRAGGHPLPRISIEGMTETLLKHGSDDQLDWVNPSRADDIETVDVRIVVEAFANTKRLSNIDPTRLARWERATEGLRNRYLERAASGELRWVLTQFPTDAAAQDAEMSLTQYEDFVYGAGFLDDPDPTARWREFGERID